MLRISTTQGDISLKQASVMPLPPMPPAPPKLTGLPPNVHQSIEDAREAAREARQEAKEAADETRQKAKEAADEARQAAKELKQQNKNDNQ